MRIVRGVSQLYNYLASIGVPIGLSTLYNDTRAGKIPHRKVAEQIYIFNLDKIDEWLKGDYETENNRD